MNQSATLYRITKENFQVIEKMEPRHIKPAELTDGNVTFSGSFMGLEFILTKGLDEDGRELIGEIFNPIHYIGPTDTNIFNLDSDEEQLWESENAAGYLSPIKVKKIHALLSNIQESQVAENFDADELNANQIYPSCWHNNEDADLAFNRRQILEDFVSLQNFFRSATESNYYVLSYLG